MAKTTTKRDRARHHPAVAGLLRELPAAGQTWTQAEHDRFMQAMDKLIVCLYLAEAPKPEPIALAPFPIASIDPVFRAQLDRFSSIAQMVDAKSGPVLDPDGGMSYPEEAAKQAEERGDI